MSAALPPASSSSRIELIDALRGSALLGLYLLHAVEHFEYSRYPLNPPAWLAALDKQTTDTAFFLFGGKAYAIFAMMFGLSFFLIIDGAAKRGQDFRGRFLWRLAVLGAIGYLFGLIYCGEILTMLAALGVLLVFVHKVSTRVLVALSIALLLQLPFLWQLGHALYDPAYAPYKVDVGAFYKEMYRAFDTGSWLEFFKVNAWTSLLGRSAWALSNGRYLQMPGLFLWGLLLGRSRVLENPAAAVRLAWRVLLIGGVTLAILYVAREQLLTPELPKTAREILKKLFSSYVSLAQMTVWASGFVLLYHRTILNRFLRHLAPYGRTSLTGYVVQNAIGALLFYPIGAGLIHVWGQFYSILFALGFFGIHLVACHLWLRRYHYGPLEWIWRCLTQLSFQTPLRRRQEAVAAAAVASLTPAK